VGILAVEFIRARSLLEKVKTKFQELKGGSLNG